MRSKRKKTPIPSGLLKDKGFLREVKILLDSCSLDPETVRRARDEALEIVGPCEKAQVGGLKVVPMRCSKFLGKGEPGQDLSAGTVIRDQHNVHKTEVRELKAEC